MRPMLPPKPRLLVLLGTSQGFAFTLSHPQTSDSVGLWGEGWARDWEKQLLLCLASDPDPSVLKSHGRCQLMDIPCPLPRAFPDATW